MLNNIEYMYLKIISALEQINTFITHEADL